MHVNRIYPIQWVWVVYRDIRSTICFVVASESWLRHHLYTARVYFILRSTVKKTHCVSCFSCRYTKLWVQNNNKTSSLFMPCTNTHTHTHTHTHTYIYIYTQLVCMHSVYFKNQCTNKYNHRLRVQQLKQHTYSHTHTHTSCMPALCFKKKMQFTKCSPHTVIDVVLWFYILLMIFTFQFHSYLCFCVLRGK